MRVESSVTFRMFDMTYSTDGEVTLKKQACLQVTVLTVLLTAKHDFCVFFVWTLLRKEPKVQISHLSEMFLCLSVVLSFDEKPLIISNHLFSPGQLLI